MFQSKKLMYHDVDMEPGEDFWPIDQTLLGHWVFWNNRRKKNVER